MCGRTAQTQQVVALSARHFGLSVDVPSHNNVNAGTGAHHPSSSGDAPNPGASHTTTDSPYGYEWRDNYNLSPGMDAMVFYKDDGEMRVDRKVWGLVNKRGTLSNPLPRGMGKHFEGLMFNARAETLYQKPSFGRLTSMGRSCIIAFDGFFEWKAELKGKKQPYFVRSKKSESSRPFLLMAGLWNRVPTCWEDAPYLDTFTIITTEVCEPLRWLHTRMPVCVWDVDLAQQWLDRPTEKIHNILEQSSRQTPMDYFDWHSVTTDMSSTKFRSADSLKPLAKVSVVKDYFMAAAASKPKKDDSSSSAKESADQSSLKRKSFSSMSPSVIKKSKSSPSPVKKASIVKKKGTLDAFFSPKSKKNS